MCMWLRGGPDGQGRTGCWARGPGGQAGGQAEGDSRLRQGPSSRVGTERWVYAAIIGEISLNLIVNCLAGGGVGTAQEGGLRR